MATTPTAAETLPDEPGEHQAPDDWWETLHVAAGMGDLLASMTPEQLAALRSEAPAGDSLAIHDWYDDERTAQRAADHHTADTGQCAWIVQDTRTYGLGYGVVHGPFDRRLPEHLEEVPRWGVEQVFTVRLTTTPAMGTITAAAAIREALRRLGADDITVTEA